MASNQRSSNSTLLAAAAGIGVALIAGAVTLAFSQPQQQAAGDPVSTHPAATKLAKKRDVKSISDARSRMAKRRRGAWMEASSGKNLDLKSLQAKFFELRAKVAASGSDHRFQRGEAVNFFRPQHDILTIAFLQF